MLQRSADLLGCCCCFFFFFFFPDLSFWFAMIWVGLLVEEEGGCDFGGRAGCCDLWFTE